MPSVAQRLLVSLGQNRHVAGEQTFWTTSTLVSKLTPWFCFYWKWKHTDHRSDLRKIELLLQYQERDSFFKVVLLMVYIKRDYQLFLLLLKDPADLGITCNSYKIQNNILFKLETETVSGWFLAALQWPHGCWLQLQLKLFLSSFINMGFIMEYT